MNKKIVSINIFLLGMVSFLTDLSSEMIMPIFPMFITALGGTGLGVFHTSTGMAMLPASVIAGLLWQYDPIATFIYEPSSVFIRNALISAH